MRLLLDTHVALWALSDEETLSRTARTAIEAADELFLSVVTPWELVIKAALGKIVLHRSVGDICRELDREFGARSLDVTRAHVLAVGELPSHHGDPFDRLLIAQAIAEGLTVATRDHAFAAYGVPLVRA